MADDFDSIKYPEKYATLPPIDFSKSSANKTDVQYRLFTKLDDSKGELLTEETVSQSDIDKTLPTKLLIHGWTTNESSYWYEPLKNEYLKKDKHNVFYVDYSKADDTKSFHVAAANSKAIGEIIAEFIISSKIQLKNVHLVAHSLGSHVAGFAGKHVFSKTKRKLGRITATDPAGPLFEREEVTKEFRLCEDDAEFVDVVHTDVGHYGFIKPMGHVDFYPNGGFNQPGCPPLEEDDNCHHARSNLLFIESVNSNCIKAKKCKSWGNFKKQMCEGNDEIVFGENAPKNARGTYFFLTNSSSPYAIQ